MPPLTLRSSCCFVRLQLKITQYNGEPLTQEDLGKMVHLSVTQKKSLRWEVKDENEPRTLAVTSAQPEDNMPAENMPEEMELPFSADGEVHLSIPISEKIESLIVDVRCRSLVALIQ